MNILLPLFIFFLFIGITLLIGGINEKKHYRSIKAREEKYKHILMFNEKRPPSIVAGKPFYLVQGSAVISGDYFKQFIASLKQIIGGRLTSYESILDRGRREAILRMKEQAAHHGATMIFNVQITTTTLGQQVKNKGLTCAEIIAYGTAWVVAQEDQG